MKSISRIQPHRGFALIVTLSLMILLTVIAVGLLSLSSISLRSTGQTAAMATARANARLALMLAMGEIQKTAGPDTRITAPANIVQKDFAPGIMGVWKSWRPPTNTPDYTGAKAGDNFLGYLMSNPTPELAADPTVLPTGGETQRLVGPKSVGNGNSKLEVSVPKVRLASGKGKAPNGNLAWLVLDEGVKGRINLEPSDLPVGQGETITHAAVSSRNGFEGIDQKLAFLNEDRDKLMETLPKLVSLSAVDLAAESTDAIAPYFHDFTISSNLVQADVVNGGLKTDLSMLFDGNLPKDYTDRFLYSDTSTPFQGANADTQWSLYANYAKMYQRKTKDLTAALPKGYKLESVNDGGNAHVEPDMAKVKEPVLMPTVIRVDTVFSIIARDAHQGWYSSQFPYMLHIMYMPVITLHNPFNVPRRGNLYL